MRLKPHKFLVLAVAREEDDAGNATGEVQVSNDGQPFEVFGVAGLVEWAEQFEGKLDQTVAMNAATPDTAPDSPPIPANRAARRRKPPAKKTAARKKTATRKTR